MITLVGQIMNLSMAVVTWCNAVIRLCRQNLVGFELTIASTRVRISCLEKTAAPTAAVVVRHIGVHFNKIFFAHYRFHRITQIFSHRIPKGFSDKLTRILHRKFNFEVLVPVGIDFQLSFLDPLGIILNDALDLKLVLNIEFLQSGPDCKKLVPSLGIEPVLAF